jgi:NADH-quinone oxidoreductase subunit M
VLLAGLVLKVGAYGLLRFILPLFPAAAHDFAPVGMVLGLVGILYGAAMAFAQTDLKRLVAYTSVSHMGFVMLGVFAGGERALQGAVLQMLCHGVSTGALFVLVGDLQDRLGTREMGRMGGLWATAPRMCGVALFFALASMSLPGLGNFVAEFLVLLGAYAVSVPMAAVAAGGMVLSVIYALWIIARVFHGPNERGWKVPDLSARETAIFAVMIAVIVWLGVYPQPVLDTARPAIEALRQSAPAATDLRGGSPYPPREAPGNAPGARWVRRPTAQDVSACGTAGLPSRGRAATAFSTAGQASRATFLSYADGASGGPP